MPRILLALMSLLILASPASAAQYRVLHTFNPVTQLPFGVPLVVGSTVYGTYVEENGGAFFQIGADGNNYEVLHSFGSTAPANQNGYGPSGILAFDGSRIYGTTSSGGASGSGTVFGFDPVSRDYQKLADNTQGSNSLAVLGVALGGSALYGSTGAFGGTSTIFRVQTDGSAHGTIHTFNASTEGVWPNNVIVSGSTIYGTLNGFGGVVFAMNTDGSNFRALHVFADAPTDGAEPSVPALVLDGTTLYGTTRRGGAANGGTVFKVNVDGTNYEMLHEFALPGNVDGFRPLGVALAGSKLVGISQRGVFSLNKDGSEFEVIHLFPNFPPPQFVSVSSSGNTVYGFRNMQGGPSELFAVTVPEPGSIALAAIAFLIVPIAHAARNRKRRSNR